MDEKEKTIELRSEEVQEVMGMVPSWIIRWGITLLAGVVVLLLAGSCFFRYPDVISTRMTLTSREPVAALVARNSGKISHLYVKDGAMVQRGELLAVLENPAVTDDVLVLEKDLSLGFLNPDSLLAVLPENRELALGDVQSAYAAFLSDLHEFRNYRALNYYPQKISMLEDQLDKHHAYYALLQKQEQIISDQYVLARRQYDRDSLLYAGQVLSASEHETSRTTYLQSLYSLENAKAAVEMQAIQLAQLEESLLDLRSEKMEKEQLLSQHIRTSGEQLMSSIAEWKLNYCVYAPIAGKVSLTTYWNENQFIPQGDTVCTLIPENDGRLIGKAQLPTARSGKVKVGQRVIVRFENYPDEEFGTVEGRVLAVSLVPAENNYMVEIGFPRNLETNYGYSLPVLREMPATAEIVTEELYLIERLVQPVRKIWKEGFQGERSMNK